MNCIASCLLPLTYAGLIAFPGGPAALGRIQHFRAAVSYENRFLLKELSTRSAALAVPLKSFTAGLSMRSFGYSLYSENSYGFMLARNFGSLFSAGLQADYLRIRQGDLYGSKGFVITGAGLLAKPLKNWSIGTYVYNIGQTKLLTYDAERIPSIFSISTCYEFSSQLSWCAEAEKHSSYPIAFKTGIEYQAAPPLSLRCSMRTLPATASFGLGLKLKGFTLNMAASWHPVLGISSAAGLEWVSAGKTREQ